MLTVGHKDVVELLLTQGSDLEHRNKAGCTPLMLAARYNVIIDLLNTPTLRILLCAI